METQPYTLVSPEHFALLTEEEIALLEAINLAFLSFVRDRDAKKRESTDPPP